MKVTHRRLPPNLSLIQTSPTVSTLTLASALGTFFKFQDLHFLPNFSCISWIRLLWYDYMYSGLSLLVRRTYTSEDHFCFYFTVLASLLVRFLS